MSVEAKASSSKEQNGRCSCSCDCRGRLISRYGRPVRDVRTSDDALRWQIRSAKERIRVSENIHWRDEAINDFTGNLSGVIGFKKILHNPPGRHPSTKRKKTLSAYKNSANKKKTSTERKPTKSNDRHSEDLTKSSINIALNNKQENEEIVGWRTVGKSENLKTAWKPEIILQQRTDRPKLTEIAEDLPEKPTAELDISSEDDESSVPVKKSSSDNTQAGQKHTSKLLANDNRCIIQKRKTPKREDDGEMGFLQREVLNDLWRTRGETLLGYDFVAGSVDNLPFLSSGSSYRRSKEFREANREHCMLGNEGGSNEENTEPKNLSDHHCLRSYKINERLFAETEGRPEESVCGICCLLRGQTANRPVHLSISVPTEAATGKPKRTVSAGKSRITSLSLMQNCNFKVNEASRRYR